MSHSPDLRVLKHMEMVEHMKKDEIDYKALYENALEGAKNGKCIKDIFPELAESEDKRIRKALIHFIKQGEIKGTIRTYLGVTEKEMLAWLEKQGEQKPTDNVEPKFKVGDWVVSPNGVYWHIDAIRDSRYQVSSGLGNCADWPLNTNIYHKFTIQDAKDGDVLAWYDSKCIALFKEIYDNDSFKSYGFVGACTGVFENGAFHDIEDVHPATKEQREFLFQKMKEVGYEWDSENKVLRKIEPNPAWNKEDERMLNRLIKYFDWRNGYYFNEDEYVEVEDWLKSLKDRMTWKPTDEQMSYLDRAIEQFDFCDPEHAALEAIYTHFKKPQNQ